MLDETVFEQARAPGAGAAVPVVGVGASAGGLEVFRRLLADLPLDTGFAIVFVQHLDPTHPSLLADILGRSTAMRVTEAADGARLEANCVYVIKPNVDLTIASGALQLTPRTQTPGSHMPIDRLFKSMAAQCGSRAIGVVLSGTGSDGSAGVEAIKAAGGVTFAQDAASAKFGSMPQAAVATGCIDFVLPPEEIGLELVRIGHHPFIADGLPSPEHVTSGDNEKQFGLILAILHGATGIDFSLYREKMVKRRILRRLALSNTRGVADYAAELESNPSELAALQRDLLIGVTTFFRDPEVFDRLKTVVFPRIVQGRPANETIRVWVAGCATGEEAFSIAIVLQEYMTEVGGSWPVQIFASDISLGAIEKARTGRYLENIAADLTHERLNRYFTKVEGGYQISKKLREMCVFTQHNLIEDPPFSKVDLVSCRNVLIYLGSVQKHIIPLFHYALRPGGFLLLGASEAAGFEELFSVADADRRIYTRRETVRKPFLFSAPSRGARRRGTPEIVLSASGPLADVWDEVDTRKQVDRILLSKYTPAGVVVDEELEVIEIRGKASPYLTLPVGKMSFNLMKLIPDIGLFLGIEKLIRQVRQSGEPARQECIPHDSEGTAGSLNVEVIPLTSSNKFTALVLLEPIPARAGERERAGMPSLDPGRDLQIHRLKQQLGDARHRYVAAMEDHQASREESQNTTEEALSANEEMQSLNEELETAKEELQSINEELITINDELQAKNAALAQARDFAMSIVETVRQPLLVLDKDLHIKMANGAFYRAFQTSPAEAEGQQLYTLSRGSWDMPRLRSALDGLLRDDNMFPDLEMEQDFPGVGRRSLVLTGCHINHLKMILLAVDDVTERELAQQALRKTEENLRQSQKMEAVGRLAGGIAHDFNNLLTVVIGYSSLLNDAFADDESVVLQIGEIRKAAERAAALTEQLLAFSRRQILQPKVLQLNAIVQDFGAMLQRLVIERIRISIHCDSALWQVRADPGEIGRAIMNLALNARDAMPEGGALTIRTQNITLAPGDDPNREPGPGRYVTISVQDTGVGMGADVRAHIFEPFYTTKDIGKGVGLGLATVLGIVEQSGGVIRCDSTMGQGTTFTIFLPAVVAAADKTELLAGGLAVAPKGSEVVLLVDDEEIVRVLAGKVLKASGYTVYEAADGREALAFCESHKGRIDLLVSDVVMPDLGGRELAEGALQLRPDLQVMFMSGHTEDVILKEGVRGGASFIQKPFTPVALARKVRETLDSKPGLRATF